MRSLRTEELEEIKTYYYDVVVGVGDRLFEDLSKRQINRLKNSIGFISWKIDEAKRELFLEFFNHLGINKPPKFPPDREG